MYFTKNYTVITGASQGLGKAFAECCAAQNRNLILISLPNEGLPQFKNFLNQKYNVEVHIFELDLTKKNQLIHLCTTLKQYKINMLLNNAGIGGTKAFLDVSTEYIDTIVLLNMRSLVLLTHQLLPQLKMQKEAFILNISSLAAFAPMPYKTIYPASKAFVYSFSRGLQVELKNTTVHVSVAHPGGMATNTDVSKRLNSYKGIVRFSVLSPKETAEICLRNLFQKKVIIIPGNLNKISSVLQRILPISLQLKIIEAKMKKEIKLSS